MDFQFIGDSFRLFRNKRFIQWILMMGIQIIHDQTDLLGVWIHLIHKRLPIVRKINFCPVIRYCRIALPTPWFKSEKDVCRTIPFIFCVILTRFPRLGREGIADFPNELSRHFIDTYLWTLWIIGLFIDISDFFHLTDKGGVVLRRNTPFFCLPGFKFIFLMFVSRSHVRLNRQYPIQPFSRRASVMSTSYGHLEVDYHRARLSGPLLLR